MYLVDLKVCKTNYKLLVKLATVVRSVLFPVKFQSVEEEVRYGTPGADKIDGSVKYIVFIVILHIKIDVHIFLVCGLSLLWHVCKVVFFCV